MAIGIVKTINGVKQLVPLTTDSGQGLPLGAWTSFEDDQPRNGYLKSGTTFNQSDYPALYAMLGTNVVPERFDHSRLGDWENITISQSSSSPNVMQYDGVITGHATSASSAMANLYINGEAFPLIAVAYATNYMFTIPVKKGDEVYVSASVIPDCKIAYYTHPMFIKAVIGPIEDSAADQVVQNINNSRSYSTEEVNTGKTWIDGKPIYRRAFEYTASVGGEFEVADTTSWNIDKVTLLLGISNGLSYGSGEVQGSYFANAADRYRVMILANKKLVWDCGSGSSATITIEYTKTTD